jgi:hypothetical protein
MYPDKDWNETSRSDLDEAFVSIFDEEWSKATKAIREAAGRVWDELKELDHINPLNLACT